MDDGMRQQYAEAKASMTERGVRRCIGSAKFGIEAHDALISDFPAQPSQKDGLGRMCRDHWTQYTRGLRTGSIEGKSNAAAAPAAVGKGKVGKIKPAPKPVAASKPKRRRDATPEETEAYNAQVREEAQASTPDFEALAAAEHDAEPAEDDSAMLADRRDRVRKWRRDEFDRASGMRAPGSEEA